MARCKDCLHLDVCNGLYFNLDQVCLRTCRYFKEAAKYAEVVESGWKFNKDGSGTCEHCHRTTKNVWDYDNWMKHCPDCGARMVRGDASGI